jgi:hypothetical protein
VSLDYFHLAVLLYVEIDSIRRSIFSKFLLNGLGNSVSYQIVMGFKFHIVVPMEMKSMLAMSRKYQGKACITQEVNKNDTNDS